jgi:hypothetical protein
MSKIKVFPIDMYMTLVDGCQPWDCIAKGLKEVDPVYNFDAVYLDRFNKFAWWVYKGKGYTSDSLYEQVKYEYSTYLDRPLSRDDLKELIAISKYNNLGNNLKKLINKNRQWWQFHDMMLDIGRIKLRWNK